MSVFIWLTMADCFGLAALPLWNGVTGCFYKTVERKDANRQQTVLPCVNRNFGSLKIKHGALFASLP